MNGYEGSQTYSFEEVDIMTCANLAHDAHK